MECCFISIYVYFQVRQKRPELTTKWRSICFRKYMVRFQLFILEIFLNSAKGHFLKEKQCAKISLHLNNVQLHNEENLKKAESDLKVVVRILDECIRSASISDGDMVDGRYAQLESRYLDAEGKEKKNRDKKEAEKSLYQVPA